VLSNDQISNIVGIVLIGKARIPFANVRLAVLLSLGTTASSSRVWGRRYQPYRTSVPGKT
jgi:hypothetical protein